MLQKIYKNFVANFRGLNVPDDIECEFFTVISIDSLLAHKSKYYLNVYLYIVQKFSCLIFGTSSPKIYIR